MVSVTEGQTELGSGKEVLGHPFLGRWESFCKQDPNRKSHRPVIYLFWRTSGLPDSTASDAGSLLPNCLP